MTYKSMRKGLAFFLTIFFINELVCFGMSCSEKKKDNKNSKAAIVLFAGKSATTSSCALPCVTTLAGVGSPGNTDGVGKSASFNNPTGVAVDSQGNVYVADSGNSKIRKITAAGIVTTLAGSGTIGSVDGIGTSASFNFPYGVAVDSSNTVYVADYSNHKIRKITNAGVVTTLAGSGTSGSADGTGISASFSSPYGIIVDNTNTVYIADYGNSKIRKVSPTGTVTTLAGSGSLGVADGTGSSASFNSLYGGITVDNSYTVYVGDTHKVRKITSNGIVTTFAGADNSGITDGVGTSAGFNRPGGVAVDNSGNVYVADSGNFKIRKITSAGVVSTIAGSGISGSTDGSGISASFSGLSGITIDSIGNLYVGDSSNHKIRKIVP